MRLVYCKTGRPEIANDVMGVHQTDVWTMLKPQDEWRPGLTRDALIEEMDKLLSEHVPGMKFGFSQPIEMRVNELVAGVKSDVAALIYGPDLKVLRRLSLEIERVLGQIPGAHDIKNPTAGRLPMLRIKVRRDQLARYGIKASDVLDSVAALGGTTVGTVFEEDKRHPLAQSGSPSRGATIPTRSARSGSSIPRDARSLSKTSPRSPRRKGPTRSSAKTCSTARSSGSMSGAATSPVSWPTPRPRSTPISRTSSPRDTALRWGGQFEHLQTASKRLMIVVPVAMLLIFLLLYGTFHSIRLSLLIYTAVPMAATGGVFALYPARAPLFDLGRRRLHRPLWRGRAQRPGLGQRRRAPAAGGSRASRGRARGGRRPLAADPDDRPGRRTGLHPHGDRRPPRAPRSSGRWPRSSSVGSSRPRS